MQQPFISLSIDIRFINAEEHEETYTVYSVEEALRVLSNLNEKGIEKESTQKRAFEKIDLHRPHFIIYVIN